MKGIKLCIAMLVLWGAGKAQAPILNAPLNNADTQIVKINFSFYHLSGMQFYDIQIDTSALFNSSLLRDSLGTIDYSSSTAGDLISKTILHLYYGTTHYWRVRAHGNNTTSGWSETRAFTTKHFPYVVTPTASQVFASTPSGMWRNIGGSTSYQLQVGNTNVFISPIYIYDIGSVNVNQTNNSIMSRGLSGFPDGDYFFRMKAYNAVDSSDWSPVVNFSLLSPNTISENKLGSFSVFPNPAKEQIKIISTGNIQLSIFDVEGKVVFQSILHSISEMIDISYLSQGTYFLQMNTVDATMIQKLIITP